MFSNTKNSLCLLIVMALTFTGCADITQKSTVSGDGQVKQETKILAEKTATDQYIREMAGTSFITLNTVLPGVETIEKDGKSYYSLEEKQETTIAGIYEQKIDGDKLIEEMISSGDVIYSQTETCLNIDGSDFMSDLGRMTESSGDDTESVTAFYSLLNQITTSFTCTFPYRVTETNGTLSEDGFTVSFDDKQCKSSRIYARTENDYSLSGITEGGISPKNRLTFPADIRVTEGSRAISSGGTLSDGSHLLKAVRGDVQKSIYTIVDTKGPSFSGIKNGRYYKKNIYDILIQDVTTTVSSATLDGKNITDVYAFDVKKNGKHTVIARDAAGNTSKCTFYLDKISPTIRGVKNGQTYRKPVKIRCKDNMKLSSVKVNGKKKGSSFTLKKKGNYTITARDKAGNTRKLKIKIK